MVIVLTGGIGRSVTGGQAWANLQYLIGLSMLGHDVFYLEDSGEWSGVYKWEKEETTWDLDYPGEYVRSCLEPFGFAERWMYRAGDKSAGLPIDTFREVCERADLLLIRGIPFLSWRPEYDLPRRRAFIDIDPGFTQFRYARGEPAFIETLDRSEALFTIGQRIESPDCPIPTLGRKWLKTVSPVVLQEWPFANDVGSGPFTSIIRWRGMKDLNYKGVEYGQRNREFEKFFSLPSHTNQILKIAVTGGGNKRLADNGWQAVDGWTVSKTPQQYRRFIQRSRAEFGVAKNTYVDTRSGWFSDRSVCYLASGRPVLVQDTGIASWLPTGEGVVTFSDLDEAVAGIEAINKDYESHRKVARDLATGHFAAERVLPALLEAALA